MLILFRRPVGAGCPAVAACSRTAPPRTRAAARSGPRGTRRRHVRAADGCRLARRPRGYRELHRGDGLASAAGLDRGRCPAPPACRLAGRVAPRRPAGPRRLRGGRLAHSGACTVPSPVDRGRPGSKHHLIVDRHGIPLAVTLTGATGKTSPSFCHCWTRSHRSGVCGDVPAASPGVRRPGLPTEGTVCLLGTPSVRLGAVPQGTGAFGSRVTR